MLNRIKELLKGKKDFGFETTLASRNYVPLIREAKNQGYTVVLIFFWLESVGLAKARVKARVQKGGHNIPAAIIERRYIRGSKNFVTIYKDLSDKWVVYDNSHELPEIMANGRASVVNSIYNDDLWKKFHLQKMTALESDPLVD